MRDQHRYSEPRAEKTQPIHDESCETWACNHCSVCGVGVLYGSRCHDHPMPGSSGAHALTTPPGEGG